MALWAIESKFVHAVRCRWARNMISSNAILVSIVFRDTDIRWKSRRFFPDCKTLMPCTACSNVALSMLRRTNVFQKGDGNAWTRLDCRNGRDIQRPLISRETDQVYAGTDLADQKSCRSWEEPRGYRGASWRHGGLSRSHLLQARNQSATTHGKQRSKCATPHQSLFSCQDKHP